MRKDVSITTLLVPAVFTALLLVVNLASAASVSFTRNLKLGDRGPDVLALQKLLNSDSETAIALSGAGSRGMETDYFGFLTRAAVIKFQHKYRYEVLYSAGLFAPTGYVGLLTRTQLEKLVSLSSQTPSTAPPTPAGAAPTVLGISPVKVRRGDTVTVTGENFTATGNTVTLGDGPVAARFENLSSSDGKTITFVYQPPKIQTMTKEQIQALPSETFSKIAKPLADAGATLDDILDGYKGVHNESELRAILEKNGRSFDEMYHFFHVVVQNARGRGVSQGPLLYGLRAFPFDTIAEESTIPLLSEFKSRLLEWVDGIVPTAHAQLRGGGYTSGIVMICTCSGAMLTFQLDFAGGGTGLYVFYPGFIPTTGSGLVTGPWLGGYVPGAGVCLIYAGIICIDIPGNLPLIPVGYVF